MAATEEDPFLSSFQRSFWEAVEGEERSLWHASQTANTSTAYLLVAVFLGSLCWHILVSAVGALYSRLTQRKRKSTDKEEELMEKLKELKKTVTDLSGRVDTFAKYARARRELDKVADTLRKEKHDQDRAFGAIQKNSKWQALRHFSWFRSVVPLIATFMISGIQIGHVSVDMTGGLLRFVGGSEGVIGIWLWMFVSYRVTGKLASVFL
eukprot:Rmarinus@m.22055